MYGFFKPDSRMLPRTLFPKLIARQIQWIIELTLTYRALEAKYSKNENQRDINQSESIVYSTSLTYFPFYIDPWSTTIFVLFSIHWDNTDTRRTMAHFPSISSYTCIHLNWNVERQSTNFRIWMHFHAMNVYDSISIQSINEYLWIHQYFRTLINSTFFKL